MAIQAFDFLLGDDGDLDFSSGDLKLVESSEEHLSALMQSVTGDYKIDPLIGVNLNLDINAPLNSSVFDLKRIIQFNMQRDNFSTTLLKVTGDIANNKLDIQASADRLI